MKKYLKIALLVSIAVMFSKGLSVQAMEPVERDPKRIRLETNIFINNHELEISISELKRIINEEQDTQSWRDICNEVQVLILTSGDTPDEKFSDEEFRAMGNMVKLKSIRIIGRSEVYRCYNGILYSNDYKVLYFCPPNIVGRAEVKIHKNTEFVMWQSVRRAEEISGGNITLVNGNIKNKRYKNKYNSSGDCDDGVRQNFDPDRYPPDVLFGIEELSAAEKLKKEKEIHEHRKTVYPKLSERLLTPFKTLSEQLSCLPCRSGDTFSFDTPFGKVDCKKRGTDNYFITPRGVWVSTKYADIVKGVTDLIKEYDRSDSRRVLSRMQKCKIINTIYNYISQPADARIKNFKDFGRKKYENSEEISEYSDQEKNTLAVFSAILMLSEPARNQMGGKYERAALREWMGHPDAMSSELRDRIIDFYRFSLRCEQGHKFQENISSLNFGDEDILEKVEKVTNEYRQTIDNINSDNPEDETLRRELRLKKIDENTGSMDKIFYNDKFKDKRREVIYKMSVPRKDDDKDEPLGGKDQVKKLINGRADNDIQKETFEYLNRSISPVVDCDADIVYQSK